MKTAYSFVVLRYVHDVMTGEFVNVGVALYAPAAQYIGCLCNARYNRLSKMFLDIDGDFFRGLVRHIQTRFEVLGERLKNDLPLNARPADIIEIANSVLPPDDSSLQWSDAGGGQTDNPDRTLEDLFVRLVERYEGRQDRPRREDEDVWKPFKKELEQRHVLAYFRSKRIVTRDYDYEFQHGWKNRQWHVYEPISFDLLETDSLLDKANRWLGRVMTLRDSPDQFKLYLLLGEPSLEKLRPAFAKAENILSKMPGEKEFIREHEAETFSEVLAKEIKSHEEPS